MISMGNHDRFLRLVLLTGEEAAVLHPFLCLLVYDNLSKKINATTLVA